MHSALIAAVRQLVLVFSAVKSSMFVPCSVLVLLGMTQ